MNIILQQPIQLSRNNVTSTCTHLLQWRITVDMVTFIRILQFVSLNSSETHNEFQVLHTSISKIPWCMSKVHSLRLAEYPRECPVNDPNGHRVYIEPAAVTTYNTTTHASASKYQCITCESSVRNALHFTACSPFRLTCMQASHSIAQTVYTMTNLKPICLLSLMCSSPLQHTIQRWRCNYWQQQTRRQPTSTRWLSGPYRSLSSSITRPFRNIDNFRSGAGAAPGCAVGCNNNSVVKGESN